MKELIDIQNRLNAPKELFNKFGGYKYRSCESILAAVKPLLKESGCTLTLSDDVELVGERIYIKATATLTNKADEKVVVTAFAREEETKKGMDGSQVTGAASSYARKYALNGLFAIDDTVQEPVHDIDAQDNNSGGAQDATPKNGSLASQKEDELIAQLTDINDLQTLSAFYKAAPVAFQKKTSRLYQAVMKRSVEIDMSKQP